ncbi:hypothetical protein HAX54_046868 [Datura stramonium]|uniref:Pre-mRNA-splicing factor Syf1/CRNKL1-like C-terminal HAT-repeats domain-containing protein n=1 Tax=Datura stramonium TaxID=4076 RepID=A0ABS8WJX3_DATST|nr:hypothetical protein [Datura stramonium]
MELRHRNFKGSPELMRCDTAEPTVEVKRRVLLEDHKNFEDAFKVYARGVRIFKYQHVKDIQAPAML